MKTSFNFKKAAFALILATGLSFVSSSCKKDSSSTDTTVTEADAAELTADAIVPANGGFVLQVNSSVTIYKTVALSCGVKKDSTISKSSPVGAYPSYNYSLSWSYTLSCNGIIPNQLTFNFTGHSSYDALRMSSSDNSTGGFVLSGLQPTASAYTLNTTYVRNGSQTSKIGRNYTFTSNLSLQSTNIMIDKSSQQILSGSATITISGTSSSGNNFSFNGTITFLGSNKATVVLNSGASYAIQW